MIQLVLAKLGHSCFKIRKSVEFQSRMQMERESCCHYFEEKLKLGKLSELQFSSDQMAQLILAGLRKEVKNIVVHKVGVSPTLEVLRKCLQEFEQNKTFI